MRLQFTIVRLQFAIVSSPHLIIVSLQFAIVSLHYISSLWVYDLPFLVYNISSVWVYISSLWVNLPHLVIVHLQLLLIVRSRFNLDQVKFMLYYKTLQFYNHFGNQLVQFHHFVRSRITVFFMISLFLRISYEVNISWYGGSDN